MPEPLRFTDGHNRTWVVALDIGIARRVLDTTGVDLMGGDILATVETLATNPYLAVDALYAAISPQHPDVDAAAFADGLAGDTLAYAITTLLEAIERFCPSRHARRLLAAVRERAPAVDREIDNQIEAALAKLWTGGPSSDNSPESPGSTPSG